MAQLFGPIPGGLGISVVFVGALLAATTGIVGATVIAMGLISLPAMLEHNYSKPLATGTICASGTLGQIIPPSIVLIILADQLSNAADIANTERIADYKLVTGEFIDALRIRCHFSQCWRNVCWSLPSRNCTWLDFTCSIFSSLHCSNRRQPLLSTYEGKIDGKFIIKVLMALIPSTGINFYSIGFNHYGNCNCQSGGCYWGYWGYDYGGL